jgi:transposase InsO family protein
MDTGASSHRSSNPGTFSSATPLSNSPPIIVGNGAMLPVTHRASTSIPTSNNPIALQDILVSPSLVKNLVSVRALTCDNNASVEFDAFSFSVKDRLTRSVILRCNSSGELYPLVPSKSGSSTATALVHSTPTVELWHQRLGHPGRRALQQTLNNLEFTSTKSSTCEACQLGKHVHLPFSASSSISYVPFQIVHADVWTSPVSSFSGYKYYLVLIDDLTHYVWTFPLRAKSDVFPCLVAFHAYVLTQFRLPILAFQSDNGKEFDNFAFRRHLEHHGTVLRLSCPYNSSQNGTAERII